MRKLSANFIFFIHSLIVVFWCSLFFISSNWWPDKVSFHFYLSWFILCHQIIWGLLVLPWTKKYRLICLLTTIMQILRGENISDKKNYEHSFIQEFLRKIGINIPRNWPTIMTFTIITIVTLQYFFFK